MDLVQFEMYETSDPAGFTDGSGTGSATGRYGYVIGMSADYVAGQSDPCHTLAPQRGNYSWTLIHEYAHMRGQIDGSLDGFTTNLSSNPGPGDGSRWRQQY